MRVDMAFILLKAMMEAVGLAIMRERHDNKAFHGMRLLFGDACDLEGFPSTFR